ncbi:alpha/beta hydrolase [Nocardioides dongxiaopingii]|uniref:alpha/beta hydrolase n=1 Tax=Nocardioides dongxiaopingii TaxID=2576036 RepID=UPI0010C765DC|nr:alpha/beta hydrolase [Nocardioides dongxiaopingii]
MNKQVVWVVAVIAVLVLGVGSGLTAALLVGDGDDGGGNGGGERDRGAAPETSSLGPAGAVPAGLEEFYGQQLAWEGCGSNQCATLTVPLAYAEPGGETIGIALERTLARDPDNRVGSLVVNPGGPGAPGTTMAENADGYFTASLLERVDVVAFDPRGTGDSAPVDCLSDADLDAFVAQDPTPDDAAERQEFAASEEEFFAGCVAGSDGVAAHVSTVEAARDMDVLRSVLGEEQLSYLGFSYGTTLGSTYAELFPGNVGRFVLDGATDPTLDFRDNALSQAAGFQTALDAYLDDCVAGEGCFLGASREEAQGTISDLFASIEEQPLPTSGDRDLQIGNAFYGVAYPLYSRESWFLLDQGLQEALDGDGTTLLALSDLYGSRNASGGYDDNSLEAFYAINCLDDPTSASAEEIPAEYPAFDAASPTFGRFFAWGLAGCLGIQDEAAEPTPTIRAAGAAPIVVVGTTRDPATPYEEAVALAEQLESGVLLTRDGDGHTGYNKGNSCIDDAVEGYLLDGDVPADDTRC